MEQMAPLFDKISTPSIAVAQVEQLSTGALSVIAPQMGEAADAFMRLDFTPLGIAIGQVAKAFVDVIAAVARLRRVSRPFVSIVQHICPGHPGRRAVIISLGIGWLVSAANGPGRQQSASSPACAPSPWHGHRHPLDHDLLGPPGHRHRHPFVSLSEMAGERGKPPEIPLCPASLRAMSRPTNSFFYGSGTPVSALQKAGGATGWGEKGLGANALAAAHDGSHAQRIAQAQQLLTSMDNSLRVIAQRAPDAPRPAPDAPRAARVPLVS